LKRAVQAIALIAACLFAGTAFAGEADLKQVAQDLAQIFDDVRITPLDDQKLDEMRGGIASRPLIHTGVVLWDEPRKTLPPQRGASGDTPPSGLGGPGVGITVNR
jgi:hypothetical protein